jgi:hypothetical protein
LYLTDINSHIKQQGIGLWTFAPSGRQDNGMTLISQGAASLALGYGSLLGFQPAIIITDSNKR